ncbi:MAG: hypothetical protein ACHQ0J_13485 [Candidatus Dormibacterales bacterium]
MSRPRIRTLKPEIWDSRDFRALDNLGKLTFIALISNADDEGRLKTNAAHLADLYRLGEADAIQVALDQLQRQDMVTCYQIGRDDFIQVTHFAEHQYVQKPTPSTIAPPPLPIAVPETSSSAPEGSGRIGSEGIVSDRIGRDRIGKTDSTANGAGTSVDESFLAWKAIGEAFDDDTEQALMKTYEWVLCRSLQARDRKYIEAIAEVWPYSYGRLIGLVVKKAISKAKPGKPITSLRYIFECVRTGVGKAQGDSSAEVRP